MRRWFKNRLARMLAAAYVAARARAIAALPHDELTCSTTNWSVAAWPRSGPVQRRASQSPNANRQLAGRALYVVPPEMSDRNNA
jgi:hypothetical protein